MAYRTRAEERGALTLGGTEGIYTLHHCYNVYVNILYLLPIGMFNNNFLLYAILITEFGLLIPALLFLIHKLRFDFKDRAICAHCAPRSVLSFLIHLVQDERGEQ